MEVLKFFNEISQIPRESGNEKEISNYLINFAKKRNLEYYTDKYYNVIIKKDATCENKETLAFQAHTDMICEKMENIEHDFFKDPINIYQENGYIKAKGTTLGADNGIGVAIILGLLDSKEIKVGKIEAIFTVQEETTMIGAKEIDLSNLESKKIISLDCGKEGKILVGSANCLEWISKIKCEYINVSQNYLEYRLVYKNFKGGHSGGNIGDKKRGNPIKLGIDILRQIDDIYIKQVSGGSKVNVIPRDFSVNFYVLPSVLKNVENLIKLQKQNFENVEIYLESVDNSNNLCLSKSVTNRIINFIYEYENGVINYENDNIVLSSNMAFIKQDEKYIKIGYSTRANDLGLRDVYLERLNKLLEKYKLEIDWKQELKGVNPSKENSLITMCIEQYKKLYDEKLEKIVTQGVVEGGFFASKIKGLEYVAIGPDIYDAHSPNERVSIKSLEKISRYVKEIVEN